MRRYRRYIRTGIFGLPLLLILAGLWGCADSPSSPEDQIGAIAVTGYMPDSTLADVIEIILDDIELGLFANPHTLNDVVAGFHRVDVVTRDTIALDDIDVYQRTEYVDVSDGQTTEVSAHLVADGPYVGNPAPAFTLYDMDSVEVSLDDYAGEIVLLYFFENT